MKFIKNVPRPDTEKYRSWNSKKWAEYECPICGQRFQAPVYGVENGHIKSCGCTKAKQGSDNLKQYWNKKPKHPNGRYITLGKEKHNISEWSKITGIPRSTITDRNNKGLKPKEILKEYYELNKHRRSSKTNKK